MLRSSAGVSSTDACGFGCPQATVDLVCICAYHMYAQAATGTAIGIGIGIGIGTCRLDTGHWTDSMNRDALFVNMSPLHQDQMSAA